LCTCPRHFWLRYRHRLHQPVSRITLFSSSPRTHSRVFPYRQPHPLPLFTNHPWLLVLPSNGSDRCWKNEAFRRKGSSRRWLSGAGQTKWLWVAVPTICPPLRGHRRPREPRSRGHPATAPLWPHLRLGRGTTGRAWGPTGKSALPLSAARPLRPAIKLAGRRLLAKWRMHRRPSRWVRVRRAPFRARRWRLMPLLPTIRGPSARAARPRVARGRRLVGLPTLRSTRGCVSPTFCVSQRWLLGS